MKVPDQKSSDKAPFNIILALGGCVLLMCLVGAGIFLVAYSKIKATPPAANETSQKVVFLEQLLKDYKEPTSSKPNTWEVQITSSQSVVIDMGWCALSEKILDQNIPHIQWTLEIDDKSIDISQISASRNVDNNQACESRALQINGWEIGSHTIVRTFKIDTGINDGWNDYAAGDYKDIFTMTVTR